MTKEEIRIRRLKNEYKEVLDYCNLCDFITSMEVTKMEEGAPAEYLIYTDIRTYISETETSDHSIIEIRLHNCYPFCPPQVIMHDPVVFHPNWFNFGLWDGPCGWKSTDSLCKVLDQVLMTIAFDKSMIELISVSNPKACEWYIQNKDKPGMFPTQTIQKLSI